MNKKRQRFKTRIFSDGTVYLYAKDCADALGYNDLESFRNDNPDVIVSVNDIQDLVSENDYNKLLVNNPEAFGKQLHIEVTKVSTLNAEIESAMGLYGLKYMFAGPMFEEKARQKGCKSVEEYIEKYDFPNEAKKILSELKKKRKNDEEYDREVSLLKDNRVFVPEIMEEYGLICQAYTIIEHDRLRFNAFLVGNGIFYQVQLYDEYQEYYVDKDNNDVDTKEEADHVVIWYGEEKYAEMYINRKGELCFPVYDEHTGNFNDKVIGKTLENRDFRQYSVFENIVWVLQNTKRGSGDLCDYSSPGVYAYLSESDIVDLLFNNNPNSIVVGGIVEYKVKSKMTSIKGIPVFSV